MKFSLPITAKFQSSQIKVGNNYLLNNNNYTTEKENINQIANRSTPKPKQNILLKAISNLIDTEDLSNNNINSNGGSLIKTNSAGSYSKYNQTNSNNIKIQPKQIHSNKLINKQIKKIPIYNNKKINNSNEDNNKDDSLNFDSLQGQISTNPTFENQKQANKFQPLLDRVKYSSNKYGYIEAYSASTNQGNIRNYNEDRVSVILNIAKPSSYNGDWPKCSFFGVYDGHGGTLCADFLRDNLHKYIINDSNFPENPQKAILNGFVTAEEVFLNYCLANNSTSGSCAIVIIIIEKKCFVANVGDSRAIMSGNHGEKLFILSRDHRPADEKEYKRIIEAGGKIYQTEANIVSKDKKENILGPLRVKPGKLSVSRTIGDIEAKHPQFGGNPDVVIGIPEIKYFEINDHYDFILIGCKFI